MSKDKRKFTSLENALRLLDLFSWEEPELGINEVSHRLGVANSTAHRLATTLVSEGFLTKDLHTKLYRLGTPNLALGNIITSQSKLYIASQSTLETLVQQTNQAAHIGVLEGFEIMYLNKVECSHPVRLLSYLGKRNPLHCTSTGQMLLAYQSLQFLEEFLINKLKKYTPNTITDSKSLLQRIEQIKKQGYSLSIEEMHKGVSSISAPIQSPKGQIIASISIAGPSQRINNHLVQKLVQLVINSANEISRLLRTI